LALSSDTAKKDEEKEKTKKRVHSVQAC